MTGVDLLGYLAGLITTGSGLPQLITSYRQGNLSGLDLRFLILFLIGISLWTIYGFLINSLPIIIFNSITLMIWIPIVVLKVREQREDKS
ncbi:SemiSWEET family sugar transporter [Thermosulfuriphilus sp.]